MLRDNGVTWNEKKCINGVAEVKFLSHTLSKNGIRADSNKFEAIRNFREPETSEEVCSFFGLGYLCGKIHSRPGNAYWTDPIIIDEVKTKIRLGVRTTRGIR